MSKQALLCYESQTWATRLLILDTGTVPFLPDHCREVLSRVHCVRDVSFHGKTIGELRNYANAAAVNKFNPDILIHFDSDDWSGPDRIAEQVRFLQSSGAGCVGYNNMLFWREYPCLCAEMTQSCPRHESEQSGESWLYRHPSDRYVLGTSMCYWSSIWKQRPFEALRNASGKSAAGEDKRWIDGVDTRGVTSLGQMLTPGTFDFTAGPRMIARIHGANSSTAYEPNEMARNAASLNPQWKRIPARDEECRKIMESK